MADEVWNLVTAMSSFFSSAVHAGMLQHRVLLEVLGISAVEEAKYILDSNAAVEDTAANEYVGSSFQLQFSRFLIKKIYHLVVGVHHLDDVIVVAQDFSHLVDYVLLLRYFHLDEFLLTSFFV